jgi:hypothetical protein
MWVEALFILHVISHLLYMQKPPSYISEHNALHITSCFNSETIEPLSYKRYFGEQPRNF